MLLRVLGGISYVLLHTSDIIGLKCKRPCIYKMAVYEGYCSVLYEV